MSNTLNSSKENSTASAPTSTPLASARSVVLVDQWTDHQIKHVKGERAFEVALSMARRISHNYAENTAVKVDGRVVVEYFGRNYTNAIFR